MIMYSKYRKPSRLSIPNDHTGEKNRKVVNSESKSKTIVFEFKISSQIFGRKVFYENSIIILCVFYYTLSRVASSDKMIDGLLI